MKRQALWKTSVTVTPETEDAVMELLAAHVAPCPSAYTDVETGVTTVSTYSLRPPANIAATRQMLRSVLNDLKRASLHTRNARISIVRLPPENWADSWKRHFPPLEIGGDLLVKPSWSKRKPRPGQKQIVLDPGLSFGTGQHPTTSFCLREIARWNSRPQEEHSASFLDIGTGSGILAIAAAKLGFAPVHAFDFDPQCVRVAADNAAANAVHDQIKLTRGDITQKPRRAARRYDLVCANLLADLLLAERDTILARVKPGGVLVVAGILKREFAGVRHAYESAGCKLIASRTEKEWRSGAFRVRDR
jgi:ribosomal protein L11 methyltransferase